jgi:hypothetical protein
MVSIQGRAGASAGRLVLGVAAALALAIPSTASGRFATGLSGEEYTSPSGAVRADWFDKAVQARAGLVRLDLKWRDVVSDRPTDASDPADPAYDFSRFDAAVHDATARGLRVLLTIYEAPDFAEGQDRPATARPGTWKPDPAAFADFARAVGNRYSGGYEGLPAVRYYEVWNEPNLSHYLAPQWKAGKAVSPDHFRELLNAFGAALADVNPRGQVVSGALAPYGDGPGGDRMRPLRFLRRLFCLRISLTRSAGCGPAAHFDILGHHPINTSGGPERSAIHPDDASTPDLRFVRRAAEQGRSIGGPRHHQLWVTEQWWETDPPDPIGFVGLRKHARWIQQSLHLLWSQGAKVVINFPARDYPYVPEAPLPLQSGIFFEDGTPKPAYKAFRFPFVTERRTRGVLEAWGKAPVGGRLRIERLTAGSWRTIEHVRVRRDRVFSASLRLGGPAKLRARVGDETSLVWSQRR